MAQFTEEAETEARKQLANFFQDKKFYCGGPIPNTMLMSQLSITTVMSVEFMSGIDMIYDVFKVNGLKPPKDYAEDIDYDIHYLLQLLNETKKCNVLRSFQSGMMLLYLKYCKGYRIPTVPHDITHLLPSAKNGGLSLD